MPTIKIHNVETNEIIEREMTIDELKQWQIDKDKLQLEKEAAKAAKAAAEAKLAALGLTLDDLKALGL